MQTSALGAPPMERAVRGPASSSSGSSSSNNNFKVPMTFPCTFPDCPRAIANSRSSLCARHGVLHRGRTRARVNEGLRCKQCDKAVRRAGLCSDHYKAALAARKNERLQCILKQPHGHHMARMVAGKGDSVSDTRHHCSSSEDTEDMATAPLHSATVSMDEDEDEDEEDRGVCLAADYIAMPFATLHCLQSHPGVGEASALISSSLPLEHRR